MFFPFSYGSRWRVWRTNGEAGEAMFLQDESMIEISENEEREIRDWLSRIGETDPAIISCVLDECRTDPVCLAYFLGRAKE